MIRYSIVLVLIILQVVGCRRNKEENRLEVTYIANEGFMVSMGGTKLLIDALHKSKYYIHPSDTLASKMMDGTPPFNNVDYFLVTHDHADHFDAEMVSRFLFHHPATEFIASSETGTRLIGDSVAGRKLSGVDLKMGERRTFRGDKAEIVVMRLDHSGSRDISNLAYLVRSNGYTVMHVGDALLADNEEYLRTFDWSSYHVDLLFMEYFDRGSPTQHVIQDMIKPKYVVLMHIQAGEEESVRNAPEKIHSRTFVFGKELETRRFDN